MTKTDLLTELNQNNEFNRLIPNQWALMAHASVLIFNKIIAVDRDGYGYKLLDLAQINANNPLYITTNTFTLNLPSLKYEDITNISILMELTGRTQDLNYTWDSRNGVLEILTPERSTGDDRLIIPGAYIDLLIVYRQVE